MEPALRHRAARDRVARGGRPAAVRPAVPAVAAMTLRNRIIAHRRIPAAELVPHHLNPRVHGEGQRSALRALLEEIGLARSVLAYVADADRATGLDRLTLIDGHPRRDELGDNLVGVEVLDVNDAEARALLLSLDPLAALADFDHN
jgi:hypothetical protein